MNGSPPPILIRILFVCLFLLGAQLGASPECSKSFSAVDSVIQSNFSSIPNPSLWLTAPRSEAETEAFVQNLVNLSSEERAQILEVIKSNPPSDSKLEKIMQLALYNEDAWSGFYHQFTQKALLDDSLVNSLIPILRKMPPELAQRLYEKLRIDYPNLSKKNFRLLPFQLNLRLAPKRSADALLQHTLKVDEFFATRAETGVSPEQGLQDYFDLLQKTVLDGTGRGGYAASEVTKVGTLIQTILREEASNTDGSEPFILVTGSLPNGRAQFTGSFDLDCQLSDQSLTRLFPKIDQVVTGELAKKYPNVKVETHAMRNTTTPHFAAQINPVFVKISPSRVEYLVYPPILPLHKDRTLQPYNYPRPRSYLLSGESKNSTEEDLRSPNQRKTDLPPLSVSEIQQIIKSGLPKKSNWMNAPMSEPKVDHLILSLSHLNPKENEEVGAFLTSNGVSDKSLALAFNLALYDPLAWKTYLKEIGSRPQDNDAIYNALVPVMLRMPTELKEPLVNYVGELYPHAPREKFVRRFPFIFKTYLTIGPKRSLDAFLASVTNPESYFKEKIFAGATALETYQNYLSMMKEKVFRDSTKGNYQAEDVFAIAKEIQNTLRANNSTAGESAEVTIAGSIPMGRSSFDGSSDVDLILSNHELKSLMPEMEARIKTALLPKYGTTHLEVHSMFSTTTDINAALVSPIMIHITAKHIEIRVHPRILPLHNDIHYLSENYPQPSIYPIKP